MTIILTLIIAAYAIVVPFAARVLARSIAASDPQYAKRNLPDRSVYALMCLLFGLAWPIVAIIHVFSRWTSKEAS